MSGNRSHLQYLLRVSVVGTSGSGKTTFARQLAAILGSPCIELDSLYWGADWTPRADFRARVDDALRGARWVVDGNYSSHVRDITWGRCTAIVWLDYSFARTFGRGVWRTFSRIVTRERLYGGNREKLRNALFDLEGIPFWILRTYRKNRRTIPRDAARAEYAHARLIALHSPAEADALLEKLRLARA
jgi:energy-coupling factor transporter ATP-binding protein EcfA2